MAKKDSPAARRDTIYRVGEAIVHHQQDFFLQADRPLKPLILKEIADEIRYSRIDSQSCRQWEIFGDRIWCF